MVIKQSRGSTFIEMLLAFSCFVILISLLPTIISATHIPKHVTGKWLKPMEVHLFFAQVAIELRQTEDLSLYWGTLHLTKENGKVVQIEKYGQVVRRRVNYRGHEVMLTNVSNVSFSLVKNGVVISLTGVNGETYSKRISLTPFRDERL